ncbi:MAG TPA: peptide MFS transporter [Rhodothermales bacterium]|nr:peptide MFS transporter [Rhodothermales bacterium]
MATPNTRSERAPMRLDLTQDQRFFGQPVGLATLFSAEMWERFSYYGLRPLLVLFMIAALGEGGYGFPREQASAIVGIYGALVYLASLPGGWVADRLLGLRKAVLVGAVLISLGHLSIGISGLFGPDGKVPFFLGLLLIVLGTGLLKPNISALVGDLYPEGGARRDAGYSIYYMGINIGAFFGQILTGTFAAAFGWHWGFGLAGIGMFLGLIIFWAFANKTLGDAGVEPSRDPDPEVQARQEKMGWSIVWGGLGVTALVFVLAALGVIAIDAATIASYMTYVLVGLAVLFFGYMFFLGGLTSDEKKRVVVIMVLFIFAAIFWGAFEQAPTSLNLFANDFTDRVYDTSWVPAGLRTAGLAIGILGLAGVVLWFVAHVMRHRTTAGFRGGLALLGLLVGTIFLFLGLVAGKPTFEVPTTWYQSINALCIILLAPVAAAVWMALGRRGSDLSSPAKFALGLAFAGVGFAVMIVAANRIVGSADVVKVGSAWLFFSYMFQSIGELCLSPVGLSSMTKLSPRKFVGQMMGVWFLASAVGNLIGGLVGHLVDPTQPEQMPGLFMGTTIALFVAAGILAALVIPIRRMMATAQDKGVA